MIKRKLGLSGPTIGALGLGTSGTAEPGTGDYSDRESIATIQAALDAGINLINTADFYGMGHSELLIGEAIKGRREQAFISVKFGGLRSPDGHFIGFDMRPVALRNFIGYSLRRLGTDYIDLYQPARVDPNVPIEDSVGAIADLVKAGYVRHIGLSEAGPGSIRRAHAVHPIAAVEVEYSLMGRDVENNVLPVVRELNIGLVAYSVLSGGLLGGRIKAQPAVDPAVPQRPIRPAVNKNLQLVERFRDQAQARGMTPTQLAFAWVLAKGEHIVPLVGARSRERLKEALGALELKLTANDIAQIEASVPPELVEGGIYAEFVQQMIKRERSK
jgi:aryl-alcohol dehydrogenase-like predicted oxidoreductase